MTLTIECKLELPKHFTKEAIYIVVIIIVVIIIVVKQSAVALFPGSPRVNDGKLREPSENHIKTTPG